MNTTHTTRFAALMIAVLLTVAVNGAMLWKFDSVAQEATLASARPAAVVTLETVTISAHRSVTL